MGNRKRASVTQGQVLVNDLWLVVKRRGLRVYEADCHTKYGEVMAYRRGKEVMLGARDESLWCDRDAPLTVITLPRMRGSWEVMAHVSRYTVRIVMWRPHKSGKATFQWRDSRDLRELENPPRTEEKEALTGRGHTLPRA